MIILLLGTKVLLMLISKITIYTISRKDVASLLCIFPTAGLKYTPAVLKKKNAIDIVLCMTDALWYHVHIVLKIGLSLDTC